MLLACELSDVLIPRFELALSISGETKQQVLERLLRTYCSGVFSSEAVRLSPPRPRTIPSPLPGSGDEAVHSRAYQRIPLWATRPSQLCHLILQAFFALEHNGVASRSAMARYYREASGRPEQNFAQNLGNMCTEAGNAYGKVFSCAGDEVRLYPPVEAQARRYRSAFAPEAQ